MRLADAPSAERLLVELVADLEFDTTDAQRERRGRADVDLHRSWVLSASANDIGACPVTCSKRSFTGIPLRAAPSAEM